jgi:hypothetical protein
MNQFPQAPEYFSNFSKIRGDIRGSMCTTGGKWKKSSIIFRYKAIQTGAVAKSYMYEEGLPNI